VNIQAALELRRVPVLKLASNIYLHSTTLSVPTLDRAFITEHIFYFVADLLIFRTSSATTPELTIRVTRLIFTVTKLRIVCQALST